MAKSFGRKHVLKAASLWARPGAITLLVGRNGCGKSVLLRCMLGQHWPDNGTVTFKGRSYLMPNLPCLARRGLFYLPDRNLMSNRFTLHTHVQAFRQRYQAPDADGVLDRLGLLPRLRQRSRSLSVGERRRAELGLAILRQPACLLADEPFRELSPKDAEVVGLALRDLAAAGCGVVVTGHEVSTLFDVAQHVIWMTAGTTREIGTPEQARAHPEFRCEYLERPRPRTATPESG